MPYVVLIVDVKFWFSFFAIFQCLSISSLDLAFSLAHTYVLSMCSMHSKYREIYINSTHAIQQTPHMYYRCSTTCREQSYFYSWVGGRNTMILSLIIFLFFVVVIFFFQFCLFYKYHHHIDHKSKYIWLLLLKFPTGGYYESDKVICLKNSLQTNL